MKALPDLDTRLLDLQKRVEQLEQCFVEHQIDIRDKAEEIARKVELMNELLQIIGSALGINYRV